MSIQRKVIYERHPVSPERKKELIAQGCKIIDARFAPVDLVKPTGKDEQPTDEAKASAATNTGEAVDLDALDADQLRQLAKERGVNVHPNAGTDKIRAALREAQGKVAG